MGKGIAKQDHGHLEGKVLGLGSVCGTEGVEPALTKSPGHLRRFLVPRSRPGHRRSLLFRTEYEGAYPPGTFQALKADEGHEWVKASAS